MRACLFCFLLVSLISLFSCENENRLIPNGRFVSEKSFQLGDFITVLQLDSLSSSDDRIRGYVAKDRFFFYNSKNQSIYTYALEDSVWQMEYITKVPLDPAKNFRSVYDIYYHNKDSIFVYDESSVYNEHADLFLINIKGDIINSFKLLNANQGEPMISNKSIAFSTATFFFHKDLIYMAIEPNYQTFKENWKPLLIFNLKTGEKEFKGNLPEDPESFSFGVYTTTNQMAFNPQAEEIYFSWAYDENIYRYRLTIGTWDTLSIASSYFERPEPWSQVDDMQKYGDFLLGNNWFHGVYFDTKSKRIHRLLYYPPNPNVEQFPSSTIIQGLNLTPAEQRMLVFIVDPDNGDFEILPMLNHFRTLLFHPCYGPLIQTQLNDAYGLDEQDFIVLAPVEIY